MYHKNSRQKLLKNPWSCWLLVFTVKWDNVPCKQTHPNNLKGRSRGFWEAHPLFHL